MTRAFLYLLAALLLTAPTFAGEGPGNPLSGRGATTGGPNTWAGTQTFSGAVVLSNGPTILNETASATNPVFVPEDGDPDTGVGSAAANQLSLIAGAVEGIRITAVRTQISGGALNGEFINIISATLSAPFDADGSTHTFSNLIPAGCFLLGLGTRITETIVGATTMNIGDGSDADLWGVTADVAVNTTTDNTDYTAAGAAGVLYVAAQNVVVTAVGGAVDFSDGTMRVTAHCITNTPPTQ